MFHSSVTPTTSFSRVQLITHSGFRMDDSAPSSASALHVAVCMGQAETVETLLHQNSIPVNARFQGCSPLHLATLSNNIDIVAQLLRHRDIDVNCRNDTANTPLHIAAFNGNLEMTQLLRLNGADATILNDDKQTPVQIAESQKHSDLQGEQTARRDSVHPRDSRGRRDELAGWMMRTQSYSKLHVAIDIGDVATVIIGIKNGELDAAKGASNHSISHIDLCQLKCRSKSKFSEEILHICQLGCLAWRPSRELQFLWAKDWKYHALAFLSVHRRCDDKSAVPMRRSPSKLPRDLCLHILSFCSKTWWF